MSVLAKSTYLYIFTSIVIFATYGWWTFGVLGVEYFTGPEALTRIGKAISILIVTGYAFEWSCLLGAGIFSAKVLRKPIDVTVDERDKQIIQKSMYASHMVMVAGGCFSIFALAMGVTPFWVFNSIVFAYVLSVVAELATKLTLLQAGT